MQASWPYRALESLTFQKFSSVDTLNPDAKRLIVAWTEIRLIAVVFSHGIWVWKFSFNLIYLNVVWKSIYLLAYTYFYWVLQNGYCWYHPRWRGEAPEEAPTLPSSSLMLVLPSLWVFVCQIMSKIVLPDFNSYCPNWKNKNHQAWSCQSDLCLHAKGGGFQLQAPCNSQYITALLQGFQQVLKVSILIYGFIRVLFFMKKGP